MNQTPVIFWGATGQARVLREALAHLGFVPVALFDNRDIPSPFEGVPLHVGEAGFAKWHAHRDDVRDMPFCVAIGGGRGLDRLERQTWLLERTLRPLTVIHPRAFVAGDARIGMGSQILAMAAVGSDAIVGDATIVNTSASVDHGCVLGRGVHIGPGAHLAGEVTVDDFAFVGIGAVVLPGIHIGRGAVVGAGAVVTRHIQAGHTVVGNPARPMAHDSSQSFT